MLTIDGYQPLSGFVARAREAIWERFNAFRAQKELAGEGEPHWTTEEGEAFFDRIWVNITAAQYHLAYDVIRLRAAASGSVVQVLKADGSRVGVPLHFLQPETNVSRDDGYGLHHKWHSANGVIDRCERCFGLDTLKMDYWFDYFVSGAVFHAPKLNYTSLSESFEHRTPIVNWKLGCIDLTVLRALSEAREHFLAAVNALARVGAEPLQRADQLKGSKDRDVAAYLKQLSPLDGCGIIAPTEWLDAFPGGKPGDPDHRSDVFHRQPSAAIVSLLDQQFCSRKAEIRESILNMYGGMSHREFDRHWAKVTEDRPELRRPGRKSRRRIKSRDNS